MKEIDSTSKSFLIEEVVEEIKEIVHEQKFESLDNLDFGKTKEALRRGHFVKRKHWVKEFLYFVDASIVEFDKFRGMAKEAVKLRSYMEGGTEPSSRYIHPHIDKMNVYGQIEVGWTPTQTDIMAEDWEIIVIDQE